MDSFVGPVTSDVFRPRLLAAIAFFDPLISGGR